MRAQHKQSAWPFDQAPCFGNGRNLLFGSSSFPLCAADSDLSSASTSVASTFYHKYRQKSTVSLGAPGGNRTRDCKVSHTCPLSAELPGHHKHHSTQDRVRQGLGA